ncbi:MAG: hypothetical protein AB2L14_00970 [Candidatus Xenobiia bacterium LiM19]
MLYEFAMTPDLFDASAIDSAHMGDILVQILRGIISNGLIANLDKGKWEKHIVEERLNSLPPVIRERVIRCLTMLKDRNRLVRHPRSSFGRPVNDTQWLNLALESHNQVPFHGILLSQNIISAIAHKESYFIELSGALDSSQWLSMRNSRMLSKSPDDFKCILKPLLRHARKISLIDPYFNCYYTRFFDTVRMCFELAGQRIQETIQTQILIHAGDPDDYRQDPRETVEKRLDAWEQKIRRLPEFKNPHRCILHLWRQKPEGQVFHNRFILTDQCGVSIPDGLDCRTGAPAESNEWTLLDEEIRIKRLHDFDPVTSPYEHLGMREIT